MEVMTKSRSFAKKKKYALNCLIVEDDYAFALDTKIRAEELGLEVVTIASTFQEIDEALSKYSIDIILSDVKLNSQEYVYDYFKTIKNLPPLILFSGMDSMDMYEKSKDSNPYVFLVKPFDDITLRSAVEGALKSMTEAMQKGGDIQSTNNSLYVRSSGKLISLDSDKISYIKAEGNYCLIHLGDRKIVIRSSISNALKMINKPNFIQIHRGYIANVQKAKELVISENVLLMGNEQLPVGRKYKKELVLLLKNN